MEVVAISYNRPELIEDMVIKMKERTKTPYYLIVIDNGSKLKTYRHLQSLRSRGYIDEISRFTNKVEYAHVYMHAAEVACGDRIVISDGDITPPQLEPDWLTQLEEVTEQHGDTYGVISLNTQLSAVAIMGKDTVQHVTLNTVSISSSAPVENSPEEARLFVDKSSNVTMGGLGVRGRVAEVHCGPFWLSSVSRGALELLKKEAYAKYEGGNPDLVYSNLLRMGGMRVGMVLDLRGIHTGLGWNRGYDTDILVDDKHYRPNIPCTSDGMPIYNKWTKKHWWKSSTCQQEFTYADLEYSHDIFDVHQFIMYSINILWSEYSFLGIEDPMWQRIREAAEFLGVATSDNSKEYDGVTEEGAP